MRLRACTTSASWFTGFVILTETARAMHPVTQPMAITISAMTTLARATIWGTSDSSFEKALQKEQVQKKETGSRRQMEG